MRDFDFNNKDTWPDYNKKLLILCKDSNIRIAYFKVCNYIGSNDKEIKELRPDPDDEFRVKEFPTGKIFHCPRSFYRHYVSYRDITYNKDSFSITVCSNFEEHPNFIKKWCYYPED